VKCRESLIMTKPGWIEEPLYSQIRELTPVPCVDLLIVHNGRLLLMKRNNQPARGLWFTPGGRILKGETLETAVKRVLKDETGLTASKIIQCGAMSHNWSEVQNITVFYKVSVDSDIVKMNDEHEDYMWINKLDTDLHPYIVHMIQASKIFTC